MRRLLAVLLALVPALAAGASAQADAPDRVDLTLCQWEYRLQPGGVGEVHLQLRNPHDRRVVVRILPGFAEAGRPLAAHGGWTIDPPERVILGPQATMRALVVVRAPSSAPAEDVHLHLGVGGEDGSMWPRVDGGLPPVVFSLGDPRPAARGGCMSAGYERAPWSAPGASRPPPPGEEPVPADTLRPAPSDARVDASPPVVEPDVEPGARSPPVSSPALSGAPATNAADAASVATPPAGGSGGVSPVALAAGVALTGATGAGAFLLGARSEAARWRWLGLLAPLYSRLAKHRVLDQALREKLYARVRDRPGIHLVALRDALGISTTLAVHHLRMLERHGLIRSAREGRWRRFYAVGERATAPPPAPLTPLQERIVALARAEGGVEFAQLVRELGVSKQRVSYNVKVLGERGLARLERDARGRYMLNVDRFRDRAP